LPKIDEEAVVALGPELGIDELRLRGKDEHVAGGPGAGREIFHQRAGEPVVPIEAHLAGAGKGRPALHLPVRDQAKDLLLRERNGLLPQRAVLETKRQAVLDARLARRLDQLAVREGFSCLVPQDQKPWRTLSLNRTRTGSAYAAPAVKTTTTTATTKRTVMPGLESKNDVRRCVGAAVDSPWNAAYVTPHHDSRRRS
jgi:hypothetical protein